MVGMVFVGETGTEGKSHKEQKTCCWGFLKDIIWNLKDTIALEGWDLRGICPECLVRDAGDPHEQGGGMLGEGE